MPRVTKVELSSEARLALEQGHHSGVSAAFRKRCQMVLLKSQGRTSEEIAGIVGGCEVVVNSWVSRYQASGLEGLQTRPGRGRKAILCAETDLERVKEAVSQNRQRISLAKAELEEALEKNFCQRTLQRFVKKTVVAINESESVPAVNQSQPTTRTKSNVYVNSKP